jgi:hypothetical protein
VSQLAFQGLTCKFQEYSRLGLMYSFIYICFQIWKVNARDYPVVFGFDCDIKWLCAAICFLDNVDLIVVVVFYVFGLFRQWKSAFV